MSESSFKITMPAAIVKTEATVLINTMLPASLLLAPIASAIMKLTIAVGQANRTNMIPRSIPLYPK